MATTLADSIQLIASTTGTPSTKTKRCVIIFITGNPGLIEYYRTFLTHLHSVLNQSSGDKGKEGALFDVYGSSIPGFEIEDVVEEERRLRWRRIGLEGAAPFGLGSVIDGVERSVFNIAMKYVGGGVGGAEEEPGVILVGHSLGAYIALEVIERHRRRLGKKVRMEGEPRIVGGIGLFPTIVNIGMSEKGRALSTLTKIPFFQTLAPLLITLFLALFPSAILSPLVRLITRMPPSAAATTTAFLKSPHGTNQALFMGKDEMETITADRFTSEIWGATHASPSGVPRPKLFFYFGKNDHWVAGKTRDELMKVRGSGGGTEEWRPKMEIDKRGIPHGFCIRHNVPVAEKVVEYVREIIDAHGKVR